jgi:hypothetical protein
MDTAGAPELLDNVYGRRVQGGGRAKSPGTGQFFVGDINGSNDRSESLADLHSQVTEAADTENRQTLSGSDVGMPQGTIDRNSRTEERRSVDTGKSVGDLQSMTRGSLDEFCVSSVHAHPGNLLFDAEILIAFTAELAFAAGPVYPGNANSVADFEVIDGVAFLYHAAGDFVPQDQGLLGDGNDLRPIAIGHVQIRMTDATRFHFDQHLVRVGLWINHVFDGQWRFEFAQNGCSHRGYLEALEIVIRSLRKGCERVDTNPERNRRYGLAPRKKNSTEFRTRSVSL